MASSVDCVEVAYQIKLAACKYDIISTTVPIRSFEYTMGNPLSVGPNMQQRFEECNVIYSLNQAGINTSPGYDTRLFQFDQ